MMTLGIAVAVASALLGLAAPRVSADAARTDAARTARPVTDPPGTSPAPGRLTVSVSQETADELPWTRVVVTNASHDAPRPPGVNTWPSVGHTIVSPALARRLPNHHSLGTVDEIPIGSEGLTSPDELYSYTVASAGQADGLPVTSFGADSGPVKGSSTRTLLVEGVLLVGLPALVFLTLCLRLSAASRADRAFRLSLAGLSPSRSAALFRLEMSIVTAVGCTAGLAAYALAQQPLGASGLLGTTWYPRQARLGPASALLVLVATMAVVRRVSSGAMRRQAQMSRATRTSEQQDQLGRIALLAAVPALGVLVQVCWAGSRASGTAWASGGQAALVTGSIIVADTPEVDKTVWDVKIPLEAVSLTSSTVPSGTVTLWVSKRDGTYAHALEDVHRALPSVRVDAGLKDPERYAVYQQQQGVIRSGLGLGLILSLASFLMSAVEIRWAGTRSLAALSAIGVRRRTLRASGAVQFAFPVLLGGALALLPGIFGGWAYLSFFGSKDMFDPRVPLWSVLALATAVPVAAATGWVCSAGRFDRAALADR